MNFITDYQLDINRGFMCKVNGVAYQFDFKYSTRKYLYYVSNILKLADHLEIDRSELKGILNNETAYDVIYCDSKQECCDLCQHIVNMYFMPKQTEHERLDEKYVWQNVIRCYYSQSNKKETYENQLCKKRTAISRGVKPAGSIIHGRRSKASIRRGCIKHQTCIGS